MDSDRKIVIDGKSIGKLLGAVVLLVATWGGGYYHAWTVKPQYWAGVAEYPDGRTRPALRRIEELEAAQEKDFREGRRQTPAGDIRERFMLPWQIPAYVPEPEPEAEETPEAAAETEAPASDDAKADPDQAPAEPKPKISEGE